MKKGILLIVITSILIACSSKVNLQSDLKLIKSIKLEIPEPSGITAYKDHLYIVSDKNGSIYKVNLFGEVVQKIKTKYNDVEGVTFDSVSNNLLIVNESKRTLLTLDLKGKLIKKTKILGKQKEPNSGLEGVCFDADEKKLYIVNEKSPKELLVLNLKGEILNAFKVKFSKDISGICLDKKTNSLWLVSDESKTIYNCTKKGELIKSYKIPVEKAEGIVILNNKFHIVSDNLNSLFIFEKPE
tara:strand:+ start:5585 stop:6310 length:726 start_codon:yes stop_codon:yes gene_type:complete